MQRAQTSITNFPQLESQTLKPPRNSHAISKLSQQKLNLQFIKKRTSKETRDHDLESLVHQSRQIGGTPQMSRSKRPIVALNRERQQSIEELSHSGSSYLSQEKRETSLPQKRIVNMRKQAQTPQRNLTPIGQRQSLTPTRKKQNQMYSTLNSSKFNLTSEYNQIQQIIQDDTFQQNYDERRVLVLKSLLKMREKENAVLSKLSNKKEIAFIKCSELCAFFSQVLQKEYIEKQNDPSKKSIPLGSSLMKKDTRCIQSSLPWHEMMDDPAISHLEKKVLYHMQNQSSLAVLAKSPLDVQIIRRQIIQKMAAEDENFARLYFLSLFKELRSINKDHKKYLAYHEQSRNAYQFLEESFTEDKPSIKQAQIEIKDQTKGQKEGWEKNYSHFNYDTMMRLESQLYHLFRILVKFIKNENIYEFYSSLVDLKTAMRETLQVLFDFAIVLSKDLNFASTIKDVKFSNGQSEAFKKLNKGFLKKDFGEDPVLKEVHQEMFLNPNKLGEILRKCKSQESLQKSLNEIRIQEMRLQIKIKALESELQLQQLGHRQIDLRLNKIETTTIGRIQMIKTTMKKEVFDPLKFTQMKLGNKGALQIVKETLEEVLSKEQLFFPDEDSMQQDVFDQAERKAKHYIEKLNNYLTNFDGMFKDICSNTNDS